jgi:hypothetical protein
VQLAVCWNIRESRTTSSVRKGRHRDNVSGADNQQERSSLARISSETARQPPLIREAKIQSELHGDVERSAEMIDPLVPKRQSKLRSRGFS